MPSTTPNLLTIWGVLRGHGDHESCSPVRPISRTSWKPHSWESALANRSWLSGMRYSAVQPLAVTEALAVHTASQLSSWLVSSNSSMSRCTPAALS